MSDYPFCIYEDCDQEAVYCAGHAGEFVADALNDKQAEIERLQKRLDAEYAKGDKLANDVIHQQMYIERLREALLRIHTQCLTSSHPHAATASKIAREALERWSTGDDIESLHDTVNQLIDERVCYLRNNKRLRAALERYGHHLYTCSSLDKMDSGTLFHRSDWPCDCGFREAHREALEGGDER